MLTWVLRNITKLDILDGMETLKVAGKSWVPLAENHVTGRES